MLQLLAKRYGKAAFTIFKRIGARNIRRFILNDLKMGSGNNIEKAIEGIDASVDTTAWIMKRIAAADATKFAKDQALKRSGAQEFILRTRTYGSIQNARTARNINKLSKIRTLREQEKLRERYPNIDFSTGEINGDPNAARLNNIQRLIRLATLQPQTRNENIVRGGLEGVVHQTAATEIFRFITANEQFSGPAWATTIVQNLDEVFLSPGSARTAFSKTELLIEAFNIATIKRDPKFGTFSRVNRMDFVRDIAYTVKGKASPKQLWASYTSPRGIARLTSSFATREIYQATGEDERQRQAYIQRAISRKENNDDPIRGSSTKVRVYVNAYTKRDGTKVRGHYKMMAVSD